MRKLTSEKDHKNLLQIISQDQVKFSRKLTDQNHDNRIKSESRNFFWNSDLFRRVNGGGIG